MRELLLPIIGSFVRWGLAILGGFLMAKGVWTPEQADKFIPALASGLSLAIVAIGLSIWAKYKDRVSFLAALASPSGTTENGVKALIKSGAPTPTITTPPDTVPGVPIPQQK